MEASNYEHGHLARQQQSDYPAAAIADLVKRFALHGKTTTDLGGGRAAILDTGFIHSSGRN